MEKPKVLVVDDEATIRHVLRQMLAMKECEIRLAGSAEEANGILDDWEPDVAMLDISMPGKSGIQLLEEIKQQYGDTEVLIMTSYASLRSAVDSMKLGAVEYIVDTVEARPGEVTIVAIGPLTNVAMALRHRPGQDCLLPGRLPRAVDGIPIGDWRSSLSQWIWAAVA